MVAGNDDLQPLETFDAPAAVADAVADTAEAAEDMAADVKAKASKAAAS